MAPEKEAHPIDQFHLLADDQVISAHSEFEDAALAGRTLRTDTPQAMITIFDRWTRSHISFE